ncbi:MAG TPA: hypothetical protein VNY73_08340 [Bacteroidia bacterium]|nr:hypothetical protein [Bacteroidia bacterium]
MKCFLSLGCILFALTLGAQNSIDYNQIKAFDIVVNYPEYTVKTRMMKDSKKVKAEEDKVYNWYSANKLYETKGGFDGKLLDGHYKCFSVNGNLREAGEFKAGLKTGKWITWYTNGEIREILHWKKGSKNGRYKLFTETGDKMAEGNFENDKLNGKFTYYNGKTASLKKYKNGEEVVSVPKQKKEKAGKTENAEKKTRTPLKERLKNVFKGNKKEKAEKTDAPKEKKPKKERKKKEKKEGQLSQTATP